MQFYICHMKARLLSLTTELVPVCFQLWCCVNACECCVKEIYCIYVSTMIRESVRERQTSVSPIAHSTYLRVNISPYLRNVSLTNLNLIFIRNHDLQNYGYQNFCTC
jgi:hypothetical protein